MDLNANPIAASALAAPALAAAPIPIVDEDDDIEPHLFFETDGARRILGRGPRTACRVADALGIPRAESGDYGGAHQAARATLATNLERLVGCGLVTVQRRDCARGGGAYRLTSAGRRSLTWAGPPKPPGAHERVWAADLVRAIADFYGVDVGDVLRGARPGPSTIARARFAYALWARGWSAERIEGSFGMPPTWAERGVQRWKRIRAQEAAPAPKTRGRKERS
jgi:hypothetical protein